MTSQGVPSVRTSSDLAPSSLVSELGQTTQPALPGSDSADPSLRPPLFRRLCFRGRAGTNVLLLREWDSLCSGLNSLPLRF